MECIGPFTGIGPPEVETVRSSYKQIKSATASIGLKQWHSEDVANRMHYIGKKICVSICFHI